MDSPKTDWYNFGIENSDSEIIRGTILAYSADQANDYLRRWCSYMNIKQTPYNKAGERTGLVVRASDSGSGDPGSILGRVDVLIP